MEDFTLHQLLTYKEEQTYRKLGICTRSVFVPALYLNPRLVRSNRYLYPLCICTRIGIKYTLKSSIMQVRVYFEGPYFIFLICERP